MSIEARFRLSHPGFALDVDLQLPARGVTALYGPSGSGKTSLLRCLAGLTRAQGRLIVNGQTWQDGEQFVPPHQRALGYVFQEASLFEHLSVQANLDYGRQRVPAAQQRVAAGRAIGLLGIEHLLARKPQGLSGGERQRVAIARALLASPQLLLMDEPLAALDVQRKSEFLPYLERLHAELDIPVVYVSHAPDEVARLADHLVVLDAGRVLASGELARTLARIDLPISAGDDAGVVLKARVVERDSTWHLALLAFDGGQLWVRDAGHEVGRELRVRILARDVSLALTRHEGSSIQNILPATVGEISGPGHPSLAVVRVEVGASSLLAHLTRRSVAGLGLGVGLGVWVQIKAVAVIG